MVKILAILILCLLGVLGDRNEPIFATFSSKYPNEQLDIGFINGGSNIVATMTCSYPLGTDAYFKLQIGPNLNSFTQIDSSSPIDTYTAGYSTTLDDSGMYWLDIYGSTYYETCQFKVEVNGIVVRAVTMIMSYDFLDPIHKINVVNSCKIRVNYGGLPLDKISIYDLNGIQLRTQLFTLTNTQNIVDLPNPGEYFIMITQLNYPDFHTPYTLTITTFCGNNMCVSPGSPPPTCSAQCGDGILDQGEQCDNGNQVGCQNCVVSVGYQCVGNIGGTSVCGKQAVCGDGVLDKGEECDNKNQPGCSSGCKIDAGYKCNSSSGSPTVCGFCGNGVVEPGQQCDNKNQVGCSVGCKVDIGFSCRGLIASACFRNNPACGNGLWEVAQPCDDGNKAAGDGCGPTCLIEPGFTCSGEPSKCAKKLTICGNGIVQTDNNEQCDNGNKQGCIGCAVQSGWDCINLPSFPSKCLPKVVIPNCGNGVLEPAKGEACDDGNLVNGDGCNYFCQVEAEWICIDGKECVNIKDENGLKVLCGNGKVEGAEACDDGNSVNGDGCSSGCKVESGWDCATYNPVENRSYCRKLANGNSYCGDGVVQGTEECDDGFPLVNGDGCSIGCHIQSGWTCERIPNILISRCRKN